LLFKKQCGSMLLAVTEFSVKKGRIDMTTLQTVFLVVQLIACLTLVCVIILQSGKNSGLSALTGSKSDSYLLKNKQKSRDARLALATKWVAGIFVILTIALNLI